MGLIVKSKIKDRVEMNVSSDVADALERRVARILDDACRRAKANNRNTLMGKDI